VADVLQNRDGISAQMADFAARVSQGHIGRAKYLATNESVRSNRGVIMKLPTQLGSIAAAFAAAQTLVDLATDEANTASDMRDEKEVIALQEAYGKGATGRGMATGASKAVKELEKEQKALRSELFEMIDGEGEVDDKGNFILELPEEVDGFHSLIKQRRVTRKIDELKAEEVITAHGMEDTLYKTIRVVDEDALMAALYNEELTEAEIDEMYPQNVVWALVLKK
jgi:hypothetical protein